MGFRLPLSALPPRRIPSPLGRARATFSGPAVTVRVPYNPSFFSLPTQIERSVSLPTPPSPSLLLLVYPAASFLLPLLTYLIRPSVCGCICACDAWPIRATVYIAEVFNARWGREAVRPPAIHVLGLQRVAVKWSFAPPVEIAAGIGRQADGQVGRAALHSERRFWKLASTLPSPS